MKTQRKNSKERNLSLIKLNEKKECDKKMIEKETIDRRVAEHLKRINLQEKRKKDKEIIEGEKKP